MSPVEFLGTARSLSVTLWDEGGVLRYRGPREAVEKVVPVLKAHKVAILKALGTPIYKNLPGVSPEFAARLSDEDCADIAAGDISVDQVQAFETAAIAREARDLRVRSRSRLSRPTWRPAPSPRKRYERHSP